jgi:hypothetical protein
MQGLAGPRSACLPGHDLVVRLVGMHVHVFPGFYVSWSSASFCVSWNSASFCVSWSSASVVQTQTGRIPPLFLLPPPKNTGGGACVGIGPLEEEGVGGFIAVNEEDAGRDRATPA